MKIYNNFNEMFVANSNTAKPIHNGWYECSYQYRCDVDGEYAFEVVDETTKKVFASIYSKFADDTNIPGDTNIPVGCIQINLDNMYGINSMKTDNNLKEVVDDCVNTIINSFESLDCKTISGTKVNWDIVINLPSHIYIDCNGLLYGDAQRIVDAIDNWLHRGLDFMK